MTTVHGSNGCKHSCLTVFHWLDDVPAQSLMTVNRTDENVSPGSSESAAADTAVGVGQPRVRLAIPEAELAWKKKKKIRFPKDVRRGQMLWTVEVSFEPKTAGSFLRLFSSHVRLLIQREFLIIRACVEIIVVVNSDCDWLKRCKTLLIGLLV